MASAIASIYQLKVVLNDIKPEIWRRLLVPATVTLPRLHDILQVSMGWMDSHLHQFIVGRTRYLLPDPDANLPLAGEQDERRVRLDSLLKKAGQKLIYEYDFGDGWEHAILLEGVLDPVAGETYPRCLKAVRACPPEDCGGPFGYMDLLQILSDPKHPDPNEMRQWIGDDFDPEAVDLTKINATLAPRPKRRQRTH
jgi:hypothetical protein